MTKNLSTENSSETCRQLPIFAILKDYLLDLEAKQNCFELCLNLSTVDCPSAQTMPDTATRPVPCLTKKTYFAEKEADLLENTFMSK